MLQYPSIDDVCVRDDIYAGQFRMNPVLEQPGVDRSIQSIGCVVAVFQLLVRCRCIETYGHAATFRKTDGICKVDAYPAGRDVRFPIGITCVVPGKVPVDMHPSAHPSSIVKIETVRGLHRAVFGACESLLRVIGVDEYQTFDQVGAPRMVVAQRKYLGTFPGTSTSGVLISTLIPE